MSYPYQPTEKWDVHTHTTLSPDTYDKLARFTHYSNFVRIQSHASKPCCAQMINSGGETVREIEANAYEGAVRVDECDSHGVDVQVISPTPMMIPDYVDNLEDAAEICKILNDDNAKMVAQFPKRFVALGALPMRSSELSIKEMQRIKAMGFQGIEVLSNINGVELDDPQFFPIFEAAAQMDMAIFIHPWGGFMSPSEVGLKRRMNASRNWRPWLIAMGMETALAFDAMRTGGVHERLPNLRVLYAHGGGVFPTLLGRLEHGAYCRPDLFEKSSNQNPYDAVRDCNIYTDTLTHNPWVLELLVNTLGASWIAMGSDYPYPLGEVDPFDGQTMVDAKGNKCPYPQAKGIYPGHMIEHLPSNDAERAAAWGHFNWLAHDNRDGARRLPLLDLQQKQRILSGTAKEWLGL